MSCRSLSRLFFVPTIALLCGSMASTASAQYAGYVLHPTPIAPATPQVATWPDALARIVEGTNGRAAPTPADYPDSYFSMVSGNLTGGDPDQPWEITADWHSITGQTAAGLDYGLEFREHQYRRQRWRWVDPVSGLPAPGPIPAAFALPAETIAQPDAPAPGQGPVYQRELTRWVAGTRPVVPVAYHTPIELDYWHGQGSPDMSLTWLHPLSVAAHRQNTYFDQTDPTPTSYQPADREALVFPDPSWATNEVRGIDAANYASRTQGGLNELSNRLFVPAGYATYTVTRAQDGFQLRDADGNTTFVQAHNATGRPTNGPEIANPSGRPLPGHFPAGNWTVTATYHPVVGESYSGATLSYQAVVNPVLAVIGDAHIQIQYSIDGGSTWYAWTDPRPGIGPKAAAMGNLVQYADGTWSNGVPGGPARIRFRAIADLGYEASWKTDVVPLLYGDAAANFTAIPPGLDTTPDIVLSRAINITTLTAASKKSPPNLIGNGVKVLEVQRTVDGFTYPICGNEGPVGPWAYMARPGVQLQLEGMAAGGGINTFELQILRPDREDTEANWHLDGTAAKTLAVASARGETVRAVFTMQLGKTWLEEDPTYQGQGGNILPGPTWVTPIFAGNHPGGATWHLRARCRTAVATGPWQTTALTVSLPLTVKTVSVKTVPPPGAAAQWFKESPANTESVLVWLP